MSHRIWLLSLRHQSLVVVAPVALLRREESPLAFLLSHLTPVAVKPLFVMFFNVLILCTHNSARSVLSEGMLNHLASQQGKDVRAFSAGSAPSGRINPFAVEALQNAGIDTSAYRSKSWDEFTTADAPALSLVITVCDSAASEACPVFFGGQGEPLKVHWGYPDPSNAEGGDDGKRRAFELTRQAIGYKMLQLLALPLAQMSRAELSAAVAGIAKS